jgi:hypothetical protein
LSKAPSTLKISAYYVIILPNCFWGVAGIKAIISEAKMKKLLKVSISILLILGLVLISGCGASPSEAPSVPGDGGQYPSDNATQDRKIVKEGSITLEVEDIAETMDKVTEMADELNGYVVSSYKYEYEQRVEGRIIIRVPFEKFDEAFARLRQLARDVPYETTTATDVTEEYVDLEAQLSNLIATEAQYLALMEKAETVEEMLKVQSELSKVRGQIEQIEGRMQYLERTSETALIEVNTVLIWLGIFCWAWVPPLVIWLRRRRRTKS